MHVKVYKLFSKEGMNMRKKFISILLSVAMVLSMLLAPGTEAMAAGDQGSLYRERYGLLFEYAYRY